MANGFLGSIRADFTLDLSQLEKQIRKAEGMLADLQKTAERGGTGGGGRTGGGGSGGLIGAFAAGELGGALAGGTRALGALAAKAAVAVGGVLVLKQGFDALKRGITGAIQTAGQFQQLNTSITAISRNMGVSEQAVSAFSKRMRELNLFGGEAQQAILNLLSAQLPLNDSTFKLVGAAQNLAVAYGTTTTGALVTITDAIGSLNPVLLEQFGITENLPAIYDRYAASIGTVGNALTESEKRQAVMNAVLERGSQFAGIAGDSVGNFARALTILRANVQTIGGTLGSVLLPALGSILQPLVNLSREWAGALVDNQNRLTNLGQVIANYIRPAVESFANALRNLDWARVANGAYLVAQIVQGLARIFIGLGQAVLASVKFAAAVIQALIQPIVVVGQLASDMWKALRGEGSFKAAISNAGGLINVFGDDLTKTLKSAGQSFNSYIKNVNAGFADFAQGKGFDFKKFWESLPNTAAKGAKGIAGATNQALAGMDAETRKKLADLARDIAQATEDFARNQARRAADFARSLGDLVAAHRDQISSIRKDIDKETRTFNEAQEERTSKYLSEQRKLDDADRSRKNDVQTQIAEELAKGRFADRVKLASLRSRLNFEDAEYKKQTAELKATYEKDTQNATDQHQERISELQVALNKELAIQQRHAGDFARLKDHQVEDDITRLKRQNIEQTAEENRQHARRMADLARRGAEITGANRSNGIGAGNAFMGGLGGAITAATPNINTQTKNLGTGMSTKTGEGAKNNSGSIRSGILNAVISALAGLPVIGPMINLGRLLMNTTGGSIRDTWSAIRNGITGAFSTAINAMGGLFGFGRTLLSKLGKGIYDAMPSLIKGGFKGAWSAAGLPGFFQGGIVGGAPGIDRNVVAVSRGEMILNRSQQANLFNALANPGSSGSSGNTGGGINIEVLNVELPNVKSGDDFSRELRLSLNALRTT